MPIATPEIYAQMLDRAKEHGFAYPSINVTSSQACVSGDITGNGPRARGAGAAGGSSTRCGRTRREWHHGGGMGADVAPC
jgi:hypothetical protein